MSCFPPEFAQTDPATILQLSQKAPQLLSMPAPSTAIFPLSLLQPAESPETWDDYERVFYACLRTGDDKSAHLALERLTTRFGADNERIMALQGLYHEAVAKDDAELRQIMRNYNKILSDNPMNIHIHKRRVALLRTLKFDQEAIIALVDFLDSFPTDAEAWCELADLYQAQGFSGQAIFSLEEALLVTPNAWNLHARLGELLYVATSSGSESGESNQRLLGDAVRRFSRSIELCDNYLRGYYGLVLATRKLLQAVKPGKPSSSGGLEYEVVKKLHDMGVSKVTNITKSWTSQQHPSGIDESEVIAARALLDQVKA